MVARRKSSRACAARVDERADVGVARDDDAVERRVIFWNACRSSRRFTFAVLESTVAFLTLVVAQLLVRLLVRDHLALEQGLPAIRGDLGHLHGGGRCVVQVGAGLPQLLVQLGRLDLGEELPLLDARADVDVQLLEVAAGPRVDRRVGEGPRVAGQHELVRGVGGRRVHHLHRGGGRFLGRALERGVGALPVVQAGVDGDAQDQRAGQRRSGARARAVMPVCSEGARRLRRGVGAAGRAAG